MNVPIEAIDAAAAVLKKRVCDAPIGSMDTSWFDDVAREALEAVALKCLRDWQICEECGEQRRATLW